MSIFSTILDKLGIHKKEDKPAATTEMPKPASPTMNTPASSMPVTPPKPPTVQQYVPGGMYPQTPAPTSAMPAAPAPAPAPMAMVDVVSKLNALAKKSTIPDLDWKVSINDLLALLGMPHKADDIKALAVELGCPESEMADSYSRNVWTHKELLRRIAENGGNIPKNLLD